MIGKSGKPEVKGAHYLAEIAAADLGLCEQPRGSNRGPQLAKFFAADGYEPRPRDEGYPWCAAAVSCWVQLFLKSLVGQAFTHVKKPRLSAAFSFIPWGRENGCLVFAPVEMTKMGISLEPGDIAVFECSHVGIVKAVNADKTFTCIEGNTDDAGSREGWKVAVRLRSPKAVRAFVRLRPTVKAEPIS